LVISLPKIPYIHRIYKTVLAYIYGYIYMVLTNPTCMHPPRGSQHNCYVDIWLRDIDLVQSCACDLLQPTTHSHPCCPVRKHTLIWCTTSWCASLPRSCNTCAHAHHSHLNTQAALLSSVPLLLHHCMVCVRNRCQPLHAAYSKPPQPRSPTACTHVYSHLNLQAALVYSVPPLFYCFMVCMHDHRQAAYPSHHSLVPPLPAHMHTIHTATCRQPYFARFPFVSFHGTHAQPPPGLSCRLP